MMIINDDYNFAFVHIPKCAGTTVREQLLKFDKYKGFFDDIKALGDLGKVYYSHLPLKVLQKYFPNTFNEIDRYESFAIVRDPWDRFMSGLQQRLREFKKVPQFDISPRLVIEEGIAVLSHLQRRPDDLGVEYTHFQRQVSYIFVDGRRVIKTICPVDDFSELESYVRSRMDAGFTMSSEQNRSFRIKNPALARLFTLLRPLLSATISPDHKQKFWQLTLDRGLSEPLRGKYKTEYRAKNEALFDRLSALYEAYYADDIALYRSIAGR